MATLYIFNNKDNDYDNVITDRPPILDTDYGYGNLKADDSNGDNTVSYAVCDKGLEALGIDVRPVPGEIFKIEIKLESFQIGKYVASYEFKDYVSTPVKAKKVVKKTKAKS